MSTDIEDCDRYCTQTDEDIFGVKLCAGVAAIEHLLILVTRQRLCRGQFQITDVRPQRSKKGTKPLLSFVPFETSEKSGLVNTDSRNRILIPVRYPDTLPVKHYRFRLNAHRKCIEQRPIAGT